MKRNSILRISWIIFPILIIPVFFYFLQNQSPLILFPNLQYRAHSFSDKAEGGNSEINYFKSDTNQIHISYTIKDQIKYPYAGVCLQPPTGTFLTDFSEFDELQIDLESKHSKNLQIYILTHEAGISRNEVPISYRHLLYYLKLKKGRNRYTIPIRNFETPDWWYPLVKANPHNLGKPDLKKVHNITISNDLDLPDDLMEDIKISEINVTRDYSSIFAIAALLIILYYTSGYILLFKNPFNRKIKVVGYKELEILNQNSDLLNKITSTLAHTYSDPELSLSTTASKIGISGRIISETLKKEYNLSFKQYVNLIRLNEGKRLLKETRMPVSEIAYAIGFNNPTHFNRTFKEQFSCSPSEYRKRCESEIALQKAESRNM